MTTHYHLIVEVEDGVLPAGMQSLNFRYALGFNRRYAMKGHVHGARYDARRIEGESDLLSTFGYVAWNPVKAALCDTPSMWPWSSYGGTVGTREPSSFVADGRILGCFSECREIAAAQLRTFVEES